jgi:NHL repeat
MKQDGEGQAVERLGAADGHAWLLWLSLTLVTVGWLVPTSALGAYVPQPSFGSPGTGDGQLELAASDFESGTVVAGSGLAINQETGDVYVADTGNHRIVQFSSVGTFIRAFGADVGGAGVDVCTTGCVTGTSGSSPGSFESPTLIAIDSSPGGHGDVYVGDTASDLVTKFEANGTLVSSWGTGGQLDGSEATSPPEPFAGPFTEIVGIAVDSAGNLDVLEAEPNALFRFAPDSTFLTNFGTPRGSAPGGLAIDPSGNFFKVNGAPNVEKFEANGTDIGQVTQAAGALGLAVDPLTGELFVTRTSGSGASIDRYAFNGSGEVILEGGGGCAVEPFGGEDEVACAPTEAALAGLAAGAGQAVHGATHTLYAADPSTDEIFPFKPVTTPDVVTKPANPVGAESATLNGEVNPNGAPLTACFFEYVTDEQFDESGYDEATNAPCEDPDFEKVGEGTEFVEVHADISGLKSGTIYHFQLAAANSNNNPGETVSGGDEDFQTLGPTIQNESASQVTASGARIGGEINPNGKATSFVVQYVTEAQFQLNGFTEAEATSPQQVDPGTTFKAVTQQLSGLDPQTAYRFRLVVTNPDASVAGEGGKFTTFALPTTDLPDDRKYEMVSPPQKTGEVIPPEPGSDLGGSCSECLPGQNTPIMPMQSSDDGNSVLYEGQPFSGGLAAGPNEYVSSRGPGDWSTESLSTPIITGRYEAFSSDLSQGVLFQANPELSPEAPTRGTESFPNLYLWREDEEFEPVVTTEPPQREPFEFRIRYSGANAGTAFSPEFEHLIFEANDALTEAVPGVAPAAPEVGGNDECTFTECNLYEWVEGELWLVNVLPGNASTAADAVLGSGRLLANTNPQYLAPNVDRAISDDGSRIFWSEEASGQIFARVDGEETLEVPGPGSCKASVLQKNRACFLVASADGASVLLSNGQLFELNEGVGAYEEGADLTEGQGGFEGILGASEDLSRVYFVDTADLTGGEENANGEEAEAGKLNLYGWDEGLTTFIGALRAIDNELGQQRRYGPWKASRPNRTAQVSPDGGHLAFMSQAPVTGYDNRLSSGGECTTGAGSACFEIFLYTADSGTLNCVSCNPSGQRPVGPANLSLLRPGVPPGFGYPPFPQPGNLSEEGGGRLFFESQDALLPQDTNGSIQDIYQWEPEGVGTCEEADGCLSLISSGRSANDSMFLDSTPSGDDAFFITREKLLPRDKDEQLDLYDARVGGGITDAPKEICNGEACKGPIASPPVQRGTLPPFVGAGNPPPRQQRCKKGFVKKQGKCVKKPKKNKKKAKHNRGGSK